ncbi:coiled-coil domain-containing protein-like protein [Dinothrombium tinctorium]|uniref:Cilia- and flagella-associated protein 36 n=2 Tax=Dinothrombium tinctorium TaxID=1965070 RepID=A0A443R6P6_9ACAR|nr:coiled-coil domain-containing protein-like protein [Dinothrombium tinctorium]RWS16037.1 coiled-coil domain-containing protein-like protein [Dinothrombium tinctorium]
MSEEDNGREIEIDASWVLDSLIGFLKGPVWNLPIITFIEQKSVVFEPEETGDEETEYLKIYDEYKNLVDRLLCTHMDELGITPEQFEESCNQAVGALSAKFHQALFEQIWAANDYQIFKRMMIQRNIDLQLQTLEILSQRYGFSLQSFIPENSSEYDFLVDEDALMAEVIKRSLAEQQSENELVGKEQMIQVTIEEKARLEEEKIKEKEALDKAFQDAMSVGGDISVPSKTVSPSINESGKPKISEAELKKRQEYLRRQRDLLMELKKNERRKQLNKVHDELLAQRPKSAKAIRSVIDEESEDKEDNEDNGLIFRKSLAARLKAEVIGKYLSL